MMWCTETKQRGQNKMAHLHELLVILGAGKRVKQFRINAAYMMLDYFAHNVFRIGKLVAVLLRDLQVLVDHVDRRCKMRLKHARVPHGTARHHHRLRARLKAQTLEIGVHERVAIVNDGDAEVGRVEHGHERLGHGAPPRTVGHMARMHADCRNAARLDQLEQVDRGALVAKQANLARDRHRAIEVAPQRGENVPHRVGLDQQRRAHAALRGECDRTAHVDIDGAHVARDNGRRLQSEHRVRRADLKHDRLGRLRGGGQQRLECELARFGRKIDRAQRLIDTARTRDNLAIDDLFTVHDIGAMLRRSRVKERGAVSKFANESNKASAAGVSDSDSVAHPQTLQPRRQRAHANHWR